MDDTKKPCGAIVPLLALALAFALPGAAWGHGAAPAFVQAKAAKPAAKATAKPRLARAQGAPQSLTVASGGTVDLCAKTGTLDLPGGESAPIWGFAVKPAGGTCADAVARLPGPLLEVSAGATFTVNLENGLREPVGLSFPGVNGPSDLVGAPPGGSTSYTLTAGRAGTYLYEAATNAPVQIPMGLFGPLVVRPAATAQAYAAASTAFDVEEILVLSELDPALNADPYGFDTDSYAPVYFLINGRAYPDSEPIAVSPGERLLLRYLNAGSENHTMSLVGARQRLLGRDAYEARHPQDVVVMALPSGQTAETLVTVPGGVAPGVRWPLYSRNLHVTNGAAAPGGMLTFVTIGGDEPPVVDAGADAVIAEGDLLSSGGTATGGPELTAVLADYGDGTAVQRLPLGAGGTFDLQHVYADNGSYTVRVCADGASPPVCDTAAVTVANADPTIAAPVPIADVAEGAEVELRITFNDKGTLDTHGGRNADGFPTGGSVVVTDWGDGSSGTATVTEAPFGPPGSALGMTGSALVTHAYGDEGVYVATVCVTDDDFGSTCETVEITVVNAPPAIDAFSVTPDQGAPGQELEARAAVSDPGFGDVLDVRLDWGDGGGAGPPDTYDEETGEPIWRHAYASAGQYGVTLTVDDGDGGVATETRTVVIAESPPGP